MIAANHLNWRNIAMTLIDRDSPPVPGVNECNGLITTGGAALCVRLITRCSLEGRWNWSGDAAEECIHGDVQILKEPFGDVDTIPVSIAPDA